MSKHLQLQKILARAKHFVYSTKNMAIAMFRELRRHINHKYLKKSIIKRVLIEWAASQKLKRLHNAKPAPSTLS